MFTILVLMVGIGIVAVPTAIVTSALSQARLLEEQNDETEGEDRSPDRDSSGPSIQDE